MRCLAGPGSTSGENDAMPVHWTISSEKRLFEVTCSGFVEAHEVHRMLDILVGSEALGYRKLFDGSQADTQITALEILHIGGRMRSLQAAGMPLGPLAVVLPDDKYPLLSRVLGILATPRRPMRIFNRTSQARKWLETAAVLECMPAA